MLFVISIKPLLAVFLEKDFKPPSLSYLQMNSCAVTQKRLSSKSCHLDAVLEVAVHVKASDAMFAAQQLNRHWFSLMPKR